MKLKFQLFLSGLGIVSLLTLSVQPGRVEAQGQQTEPDLQQVTRGTRWQSASFPVENFQAYTSFFGYRRSVDGSPTQEFHAGLDMSAPYGSYVRSWLTGKVIEVNEDPVCGTSVKVQSGEWVHRYCHLKGNVHVNAQGRFLRDREGGIQIQQGQPIAGGTRIGRVGMTGRTTGPHLHWELQYGEEWVNPVLILQEMYQQQYPQLVVNPRGLDRL